MYWTATNGWQCSNSPPLSGIDYWIYDMNDTPGMYYHPALKGGSPPFLLMGKPIWFPQSLNPWNVIGGEPYFFRHPAFIFGKILIRTPFTPLPPQPRGVPQFWPNGAVPWHEFDRQNCPHNPGLGCYENGNCPWSPRNWPQGQYPAEPIRDYMIRWGFALPWE